MRGGPEHRGFNGQLDGLRQSLARYDRRIGDGARLKLPWRLMASTGWKRWELMTSSGQDGSGSPFSADGASASVRSGPEASEARFQSVLFEQPARGAGVDGLQEPDFFADLNLDQVLESMTVGRKQYDLKPFFYAPLHDGAAVRYRHEVLRDLEKPVVLESVTRFAETMRRMREHLAQAEKLHYTAAEAGMVPGRRRDLLPGGLLARGRARRARRDLRRFSGAPRLPRRVRRREGFTSLAAQTRALKEALARVRYTVRTNGAGSRSATTKASPTTASRWRRRSRSSSRER